MKNEAMRNGRGFVAGMLAGGGLLYILDPDKCGHRRRVLVRDKAIRAEHVSSRFIDKSVRDLENRVRGIIAEAWARIRERNVPDDVLERRVCAKIGRVVSHPHAITLKAREGIIELRGPILESELEPLLRTVRSVRGVRGIDNHLEPHKTPENIPSLQGGKTRESKPEILQERWAPATRAVVGLSGLGLLSLASRKSSARVPLGIAGGALLARALTNMPLADALGLADRPDVIQLRKTVHINAPVEEVYELFANPENFPRIFEHVDDVRHSRDNMYHWRVIGPAGIPVSWEAVITDNVPNERIAWNSLPGEPVRTAGWVRFERNESGGTTIHVQFTYNPPAGIVGHAIASLLGADPKHALDDDMVRLKSLLETGKTTAHHHKISKDELERELKTEGAHKTRAAGQ